MPGAALSVEVIEGALVVAGAPFVCTPNFLPLAFVL